MMSKGSRYIFVILSAISFQAFASNFDYKSDIPADNKPSTEYLKKRENLKPKHWNVDRLITDNNAAEKRELARQMKEDELNRKSREFNDRVNDKIRRDLERDARIKENGGMTRSNFFDRE
ncbi:MULTISPECIES: hypothetical protein [Photorhabdus]|uniref:hypothetical protein n=1 Tax=Photorhabdus TaxID=29487 RepID=UPI000DCB49CB|nr:MULTISPECIES: hypothetical protein [Photorhabdus]MCT8343020.1 hypothetical protein [Photorhabdus kleinii]RAW98236.1 hypothetical protein CKY05_12050 [Photorhabdus sp. S10-54]RAW98309.1 hypothetical protein CKY03_11575 [Photorhabdus sp. S9-53]RAX02533.1 hypothetical protein CKY04_12135 [Photorhabdus sp. S8-52]